MEGVNALAILSATDGCKNTAGSLGSESNAAEFPVSNESNKPSLFFLSNGKVDCPEGRLTMAIHTFALLAVDNMGGQHM